MIKINLVREGRAAPRGLAAGAGAVPAVAAGSNINNILLLGLLAFGLVAAGGWWFIRYAKLQSTKSEVASRQEEAAKLESIIKEVEAFEKRKVSLQNRIALINQLKQNQRGPVRLLDHVSRALPDLVWMDRMTLAGNSVAVEGRALNPNAVATFVENIKADSMFDEPEVNQVVQQSSGLNVSVYQFSMNFNFRYQDTAKAAAQTSTAAPGM